MRKSLLFLAIILIALGATSTTMAQSETPTPQPEQFQCIISVIDNIVTMGPCPAEALAIAASGQGGGPLGFPFDPNSQGYATEVFDFGFGYHRVNAASNGEYTSWWHQESISTDRKVKAREITVENPLLWAFEPDDADMTVQFTIQLSVDDILDWQARGYPFDPYDAQRGCWTGKPCDGEYIGLFLLGDAKQLSINGSIPFDVSIDGCTDCDAPTFVVDPRTVNLPHEWYAAESNRVVDHDAAITIPMVNNAEAVLAGTEELIPVTLQFTVEKNHRFTIHAGAWTEVQQGGGELGACTVTANQVVNIRSAAKADANVLTTLSAGQEVSVEYVASDGWIRLTGSQEQWISPLADTNLVGDCEGGAG